MPEAVENIESALFERFGERFAVDASLPGLDDLARLAARRVRRRFFNRDITDGLLRLLCACALSAPSKSDLQQADILTVRDNERRGRIADMLPEMPWVREAPVFLVFLANGRRTPQLAALRGKPFPNDHLDLF
ncbi:MAG: nitroreductase family protein, partial [Terriglobia bacterium]